MNIQVSEGVNERPYFCIKTPLKKEICVTRRYWKYIVTIKHPVLLGKEHEIQGTLHNPDLIRRSITDRKVFLYYQRSGKYYYCAVVRHENGAGFLITAYRTDKIKEGEPVWP